MFVHKSRFCGSESSSNIGLQGITNRGCNRPATSTKNHGFPLQTQQLEGLLGEYFSAAKHWRALGKGIIVVLMSPVSLLGSRRDAGMGLQGWATELLLIPHLPSPLKVHFQLLPDGNKKPPEIPNLHTEPEQWWETIKIRQFKTTVRPHLAATLPWQWEPAFSCFIG